MSSEIILGLLTFIISLATFIIILIEFLKKLFFSEILKTIKEFYQTYGSLILMHDFKKINCITNDAKKRITHDLFNQGIFLYIFDIQNYYTQNEENIDNILSKINLNNLSLLKVFLIWKYWKILFKKLENILYFIDKKKIVKRDVSTNLLTYTSNKDEIKISKISFSFTKSFDNYALDPISPIFFRNLPIKKYEEVNLKKILKGFKKEGKKFIKELKSDYFSINILFYDDSSENYSYSIINEKEKQWIDSYESNIEYCNNIKEKNIKRIKWLEKKFIN